MISRNGVLFVIRMDRGISVVVARSKVARLIRGITVWMQRMWI